MKHFRDSDLKVSKTHVKYCGRYLASPYLFGKMARLWVKHHPDKKVASFYSLN